MSLRSLFETMASSLLRPVYALAFFVVSRLLIQVVYRLFFHPFRSIPGPFFNRLSPIPSSWALLKGFQSSYNHGLHEKYGPVVRSAPDELIFSSAEAWEGIYGFQNGHVKGHVMEKSPNYIGISAPITGPGGLGSAKGKEHTRQRKSMAPGFTRSSLFSQREIFEYHMSKLVVALRKASHSGQAVNMSNWLSFTSFDIIGDLAFAEPFGCLDEGEATEWAISNVQLLVALTWSIAFRRIAGNSTWLMKVFAMFLPANAAKWKQLHFSKTREKTLHRLANEKPNHKDIMYHIQRKADSEGALTLQETILNMALLVTAGSETTSMSLTACLFCLCTHPDAYQLLVAEIRGTFKNDEVTSEKLLSLPYLDAIWQETLRLFPAGATNQQRIVPIGGAKIEGISVPEGMFVSVSPWAAGRSSRNFYLAETFAPERWLEDRPEKFAHDYLTASQPFSVGPKSCLGRDMADFEAKMMIVYLFLNFDLRLETAGEYGQQNKLWTLDSYTKSIKTYQTLMKPDLWVQLKERIDKR